MTSLWLDRPPIEGAGEFVPEARYDTVVVGAGLSGLATGLLLARGGQRVAIVEARAVGSGTTGNTTAKLSLLQGTRLSALRDRHPLSLVEAYVEGSREGQAWLLRFLEEQGVPFQRRDAYVFSVTDDGARQLSAELQAAREAGLDVAEAASTELPFPITAVLRLDDQAQFDPMDVLDAMTRDFLAHGGLLLEGARVHDIEEEDGLILRTSRGRLLADQAVLATGTPFLDRGGYFARLHPSQSYAAALRLPPGTPVPQGMYLSVETPARSLRSAPGDDGELLLIGGNGHATGKEPSPQARLDELLDWGQHHFDGAEVTHTWCGQDYRSADRLPYIGPMPFGGGRIFVATGYDKWGMSTGMAAGLALSAEILGGQMAWAEALRDRPATSPGLRSGLAQNAAVAVDWAKDWVSSRLLSPPDAHEVVPREGHGVVAHDGGRPEAVSTVDGRTCRLSAVCTHRGGIVRWNDAERSWDCPLHGSRFAPDGTVLQGPATQDLMVDSVATGAATHEPEE